MKAAFVSLLLLCSLHLFSQKIETYTSIGYTAFQANHGYEYYGSSELSPSLGVLFDLSELERYVPSFSLQIDQNREYHGMVTEGDETYMFSSRYSWSLATYLIDKTFFDKLDVMSGVEVSAMLKDDGAAFGFFCGNSFFPSVNAEDGRFYHKYAMNVSIKSRVSYDIHVAKRLTIKPHYGFQVGLNKKYLLNTYNRNPLKHSLGLGVMYDLAI